MALQMDFTSSMGTNFKDTYMIIYQIGGTKDLLKIQAHWYVSQDARLNKFKPIEVKNYSFVPSVDENSENFIKQGYTYLKTLDEFHLSIDKE